MVTKQKKRKPEGRLLVLLCMFVFLLSAAKPDQDPGREFRIKAGFLYKFLFFAHWPKSVVKSPEKTVTIGIIGSDLFGDVFKIVEGERVEGKTLEIRRYAANADPEFLRRCRILYISRDLKDDVSRILRILEGYPVLTVSEVGGFGYAGGMINFVTHENKVGFEINVGAADKVGIRISSKLLRVAVNVTETKQITPIGESGGADQ